MQTLIILCAYSGWSWLKKLTVDSRLKLFVTLVTEVSRHWSRGADLRFERISTSRRFLWKSSSSFPFCTRHTRKRSCTWSSRPWPWVHRSAQRVCLQKGHSRSARLVSRLPGSSLLLWHKGQTLISINVTSAEGKRTERFFEKSLNLESSLKSEVRLPSSKETLH